MELQWKEGTPNSTSGPENAQTPILLGSLPFLPHQHFRSVSKGIMTLMYTVQSYEHERPPGRGQHPPGGAVGAGDKSSDFEKPCNRWHPTVLCLVLNAEVMWLNVFISVLFCWLQQKHKKQESTAVWNTVSSFKQLHGLKLGSVTDSHWQQNCTFSSPFPNL
jgi:hypothetical protein